MTASRSSATDARAGMQAVAPLLVGVFPFGLVAGAAVGEAGLTLLDAVVLSLVVFAGASQLAMLDLLESGGPWFLAALSAWVINSRLLLYSTSLAPHLAHVPPARRLFAAYFLTDQAYALSINDINAGSPPERRLPYYLGAAVFMWSVWQVATVTGYVVGDRISDEVPLGFAVPLVFLVLLVPTLRDRPSVFAAVVAGTTAVVVAEAGGGEVALLAGSIAGIAGGLVVSERLEAR